MTTKIDCLSPSVCGVKEHIYGSVAGKECRERATKRGRDEVASDVSKGPRPTELQRRLKENPVAVLTSELPEKVYLTDVGPYGRLMEDDIDLYLDPDADSRDALEDQVSEAFFQGRDEQVDQIYYDTKGHFEEYGLEELSDQDYEAFREEIYKRDASNPVADLCRNTPPQLLRVPLKTFGDREGQPVTEEALVETLSQYVPMTDANREAIRNLVEEGPDEFSEYLTLDVLYYDSIPQDPSDIEAVTLKDPYVALIHGSGEMAEAKLEGEVTTDLSYANGGKSGSRIYLDERPNDLSYSADEIAGLHKPAFANDANYRRKSN